MSISEINIREVNLAMITQQSIRWNTLFSNRAAGIHAGKPWNVISTSDRNFYSALIFAVSSWNINGVA